MRAESGACYMELRADTNHFMLEPVEAEDMSAEIRNIRMNKTKTAGRKRLYGHLWNGNSHS